MTVANKAPDFVYVIRFLGWALVVLLSLSLPFVGVMMIPLLMCAAGACPASQQGMGWSIIGIIFLVYAGLSGGALMAIRWAKRQLSENANSGTNDA